MTLACLTVLLAAPTGVDLTPPRPLEHPLGVYAGLGAAYDRGALAGTLGLRWDVARRVTLGLHGEYNPWYSLDTVELDPGTFNAFGTVVYRWIDLDELALHTTVHGGASVLLFDLVEAPSGSVGPYVGVSLLGVTLRPHERLRFVIESAEVTMPVTNVTGTPFYYRQYRFAVGLQFNP